MTQNQKPTQQAGKHTQGPWTVRSDGYTIDAVGFEALASVRGEVFMPEIKANALLIAAAPDLLEVLKEIDNAETLLEQSEDSNQLAYSKRLYAQAFVNVRAAIAKAEGK